MVVRRIRELAGLTQRELATIGGTSQSAIAAYESGARMPSLRTLQRLATTAGVDLLIEPVPALTREERRSLELHAAIATRLLEDPESTLRKAHSNLAHMQRLHPGARHLLDSWERILAEPVEEIAAALVDIRPRYRELRHITPFAGVLDQRERATVYRRFRQKEAVR